MDDDLWHGGNPPKTFAVVRFGAQDAKVDTEFKDIL